MNMNRFATYVDSVSQIAVREVKTSPDLVEYESKWLASNAPAAWQVIEDVDRLYAASQYRNAQAELRTAMIRAALLRQACISMGIEVRE